MTRITSSREFREIVKRNFPGLAINPSYWPFLGYLLFSGGSKDSHQPLLSAEVIARVIGREAEYRSRNFSAEKFLNEFKRVVLPGLTWSDYSYAEGRAREATSLGELPAEVAAALEVELNTNPHKLTDRVIFASGVAYTDKRRKKAIEDERAVALARLADAGNEVAASLLDMLNNQPTHRFTKMLEHLDEAYAVAETLDNPQVVKRTKKILGAIADKPVPFYGPVERTSRIYSTNESVCRLPRKVRKVLTQDWTSLDLRSAQLAIVARLWGVDVIQEFLATGRSVWPLLLDDLGLEQTDINKQGLKDALYALVFGGGTRKGDAIWTALNRAFPTDGTIHRRFLEHPIIVALLEGRKVATERVLVGRELPDGTTEPGAYDAFGNWVAMRYDERRQPRPASVLAAVAQSYEMRLLEPVVRLAQSGEVSITVWLHDGVCLAFRDEARKANLLKRLKREVAAVAAELNIHTELVEE